MGAPGQPNPASRENGKLGGRPVATATLIKQKFREALAKKIDAEADKWIDAIKDASLGHYMEVKQADGTTKVYKTKPDPSAWQKGMDRAFGSPDQSIDLGNSDGSLSQIDPETSKGLQEINEALRKLLIK